MNVMSQTNCTITEVCSEMDGPILKDELIEKIFNSFDSDLEEYYDDKHFGFCFLVTLFHYSHLTEMDIKFKYESMLEDLKIIYKQNRTLALKVMILIGRRLKGYQLVYLNDQAKCLLL